MMKVLKGLLFLMVCTLVMSNCTYNQVIEHPKDINVTTGDDIGPYKSLGVVIYSDTSLSFATFISGSGGAKYSGSWYGVMSELDADERAELNAFMNEHLIQKAKEMGGNSIIKAQYSYSNSPIFLPGLFGLGLKTMHVEGEVVRTK